MTKIVTQIVLCFLGFTKNGSRNGILSLGRRTVIILRGKGKIKIRGDGAGVDSICAFLERNGRGASKIIWIAIF